MAKYKQLSLLGPEQQGAYQGLQRAASGAYPTLANYYQGLMSETPQAFEAFAAPEQRRFREQIIPDLAEQFAGMGSGGLSSSGFRNAAVSAGTDLSERLAVLRNNLRMQGAQGLAGIGQQALGQYHENILQQPEGNIWSALAPAAGAALGSFLGPAGTAVGGALGSAIGGSMKGSTSPYGNKAPMTSAPSPFKLPNFSL